MKRPKHYEGRIDWFDYCYAQNITDPCVIHAGSYLTRLGKKEGATIAEDLRKAMYCLERALAHYEGNASTDPEQEAKRFVEDTLSCAVLSKDYQDGYTEGIAHYLRVQANKS